MAKEQFFHSESAAILKTLDEAAHRSGVSRGQVFEDYLHMSLCALSGGQMEEQYMATVKKHSEGKKGKRGCDAIAQAFAMLVEAMEKTRQDILGDLFQGGITYGEAGQFLTPEPLCQMMAQMTLDGVETEDGEKKTIADPCCGSGRMLLAAADVQPHWDFVGQDIDLRCVRMTAINMALRNLYGHVIWGNSLGTEKRLVYRTGFNLRGFVREVPLGDCPDPVQKTASQPPAAPSPTPLDSSSEQHETQRPDDEPPPPGKQLILF